MLELVGFLAVCYLGWHWIASHEPSETEQRLKSRIREKRRQRSGD